MSWYKISLDKVDLIDDKISIIRNLYETIWLANGAPKEAPLFVLKPLIGSQSIFFSPGAVKIGKILIKKYEGTQCNKPYKQDVVLLIGHDSDSKLLEK